jgi:pilin isopeptide linkage protein
MKKMKLNRKRIVSLGMMLLLLLGVLSPFTSLAEEQEANSNSRYVELDLEVELLIVGDEPPEDVPPPHFSFVMEASEDAPEPVETVVEREGEGIVFFEDIQFTEPGHYEYTISQQEGDEEGYQYDTRVYTVDVDVQYDAHKHLLATYSTYVSDSEAIDEPTHTTIEDGYDENDAAAKEPAIQFINEYEIPDEPEPDTPIEKPTESPKTGDDTNLFAWVVLLSASAIGIVWCLSVARRRRKDDQDK